MDRVVLDAEYIDSDDGSEGSTTEELWSPHDSESDRSCVPVSSPQAFDYPAPKIRRELSSVERQMRWAVKALRDWCRSEGLNTEFEELPLTELNSMLEKFYTNARRKDGVDFSKAGWNNIRVGIDRFLRATSPGFTIIKNPEFDSSNRVFDAKLSRLVLSGTTPMRRAGSISPNDLEKLLSSGVFSCSQPLNLLRACWFNVSLHFNVGGHLKQRKLNKFQFVFKTNSSGIEYVQFASSAKDREQLLKRTSEEDEETTVMYAVPHHPLCPVKLLKKYLKKLHPGIDALYQCPVPYTVDERVPIWYEKQALGVHLLEAMMGKISKDANLSRVYSNTSLRATSPLVYVSCGFGSSVQNQLLHLDVGVTDVSSTPSKSRDPSTAPRTSSDSCVIATMSNTLMSNTARVTGCHPSAAVEHGDSNMSHRQPVPDSIFPSTSVQDSYDIEEKDVFARNTAFGSSSPLNMPIKIQSVYGGADVAASLRNSELNISSFHTSENEATALKDGTQDNSRLPTHGKSYLRLQVTEGKLFLEPDVSLTAGEGESAAATKLVLNIHFMNQRVKSTPVRCGYELPIKEDFFLEFENIDNSDVSALLSIPDKVHITLTSIDQNGRTSLLSSYYLEWHRVLAMENGKLASSLELNGVGLESKMITGSLEIKLEIVPKLNKIMSQDEVRSHLSLSQCRVSERDRHFMSYARQWWRELLSSGPSQSSRCVKIFSQDECGSSRPVVSYVRPLQVSWGLDTPCDAAKFVSLLGFEEEASMWGGRNEIWNSLHVFLSRGKGGCEDHATLLCSLLLGFGLNAHVCCGTKRDRTPHVWVMTQKRDGDVTFWESVTGKRFSFDSDIVDSEIPFKTVGCVFNHRSFYANIQSSDLVSSCCFDLDNASHWKALGQERIEAYCGEDISPPLPKFPPLLEPTIHPGMTSQKMEEEMKAVISQRRKSLGLASDWDSDISYCLGPALCSHNQDQLDDVKEAVLGKVPPGYSFSSRIFVFNHRNGRQAVEHILTISDFESVILGNGVTLALRVRVTPYPENTCVTQVLIAGFCRSTDGVVNFDWRDLCTALNPDV